MTSNDSNLVKNQHDIDETEDPQDKGILTPEDEDDKILEGDLDNLNDEVGDLYKKATGNEPKGKNISDEVNEDEHAIAKDLNSSSEESSDE